MRVAMVQFRVEMSERSSNLSRAMAWLDRAAGTDPAPDVICLPECCDIGWLSTQADAWAEPCGGAFVEALADKAREHGVFVVTGFTERNDDRIYNSAVLLDPDGDAILAHRKIHVMDVAKDLYGIGRRLSVRDTVLGPVGLTICADNWVPFLTRSLAAMGARVIFSPCAWACTPTQEESNLAKIEGWYADRTRESDVYLLGINSVGTLTEGAWKGKILQGNSLAYGPGGKRLACGPTNEEAVVTVELDGVG